MRVLSWLWLGVPAVGLVELVLHLYCAHRAPSEAEWRGIRPTVNELRQRDELVVVAPYWAEPLARQALGDPLMPLNQVARADETPFARAIEVSILGQRAPELRDWDEVDTRRVGPFRVRVLENPAPATVRFEFASNLRPERVVVQDGIEPQLTTCVWGTAPPLAGGLHGHNAFPPRRFACPGGVYQFVGVTVVEDERYRPRRCIWAHPPERGARFLRFRDVALGSVIRGYGATSWFLFRDGGRPPIEMKVRVDGDEIGTFVHRDEQGWHAFEMPLEEHANTTADVVFEVRSAAARDRHFCFQADTR